MVADGIVSAQTFTILLTAALAIGVMGSWLTWHIGKDVGARETSVKHRGLMEGVRGAQAAALAFMEMEDRLEAELGEDCIICEREANEAVGTAWDGVPCASCMERARMLGELRGMKQKYEREQREEMKHA